MAGRRKKARGRRMGRAGAAAAAALAAALISASLLYLLPGPASLYVAPAAAALASLVLDSALLGSLSAGIGCLAAYLALTVYALSAAGAASAMRVIGVSPLLVGSAHMFLLASGMGVVVWHAWRSLQARRLSGEG